MLDKADKQLFKEALGNYPTGVAIVTTINSEGDPVGLTINSFTSLSMDHLLILWSIDHQSSSIHTFKQAGKFVIHLLAEDQKELVRTFSKKDSDRFSEINWSLSASKLPIIEGGIAVFECETVQTVEAGDHTILIGSVKNIRVEGKSPLLYHRKIAGSIPLGFHV
ncbi:flavin reductase family protein [Marinilactibacillus sp. XAAS-LB27]|uniref:flavin reductase family protein n=1 Tax=Marinilactibacillus sp. XAAS-LB27 TaxID=3114538 RepID=UPI002E197DE3|nr:flavin reductase family protein [Marinilactibacillus sp. XAAS-LB27]